ncbi:MAG: hypothetical protein MSG64_16710 [Pyrinomonadaceae bacterium MAG19_C2-C3]|nr:hypothetical protein [Pyrinomonadaceae bacterium MAG19_C2-C3]
MAQYSINYPCGHTLTEQLYGKIDERYRTIAYRESNGLCGECFAAKKVEMRAEENKAAAEESHTLGLVQLEGSEKQVAWATTIRKKSLDEISEQFTEAMMLQFPAPERAKFEACVAWLHSQNQSRFWIDNRERGAQGLLKLAAIKTGALAA